MLVRPYLPPQLTETVAACTDAPTLINSSKAIAHNVFFEVERLHIASPFQTTRACAFARRDCFTLRLGSPEDCR
jgi:hypothetical protein